MTEFGFLHCEPLTLELKPSAEVVQWMAHKYKDEEGWSVSDWCTLEGMDRMVFVLTSDDQVAVFELSPELKATVLDAEVAWDPDIHTTLYFADVYDDVENEIAGVMFMVQDKKILKLERMF